MRRLQLKKFITMLLAAALLVCLNLSAFAAGGQGSVTYFFPVDGAAFRLYSIGKVVEDEYVLTGSFAAYQVDLKEDTAGDTLAGYVQRDGLKPTAEAASADGRVSFESLPMGLYLLLGERIQEDRVVYTPRPVLLSLPQMDEERNLIWDAEIQGKYDRLKLPDLTEVPVCKIWKDDDEASRPKEITVQLLADGEVKDSVVLNKENNWSYTWKNLEPEYEWKVLEKEVPKGYTVSLEKQGAAFVLINRGTPPPPPPPPPEIPNTGLLWWPVGLLTVGGLALIVVGLLRRRCHN